MLISLTLRDRDDVSCGHEWDGGTVDDLAAEYMTTWTSTFSRKNTSD